MKLLTSIALLSFLATSAYAIEGSIEKLKTDHQGVLRSVVKLTYDHNSKDPPTCTGTLISKNIIISARHCFVTDTPNPSFEINGAPYKIVKQLTPEKEFLVSVPMQIRELSDIALVLVEPIEKDVLSSLPFLPLASKDSVNQLNPRLLMAGYGMNQIEVGVPGILHVGTNTRIDRISQVARREYFPNVKIDLSLRPVLAGEFITLSAREDRASIEKKKGSLIEADGNSDDVSFKVTLETVKDDGTANLLNGDSGGPAIEFDHEHRAYLTGIASGFIADRGNLVRPVYLLDDQNKAIHRVDLPTIGNQSTEGMDLIEPSLLTPLVQIAFNKGWFDWTTKVVTRDFKIVEKARRLTLSSYSSVTSTLNQAFIQKSLTELETLRDFR